MYVIPHQIYLFMNSCNDLWTYDTVIEINFYQVTTTIHLRMSRPFSILNSPIGHSIHLFALDYVQSDSLIRVGSGCILKTYHAIALKGFSFNKNVPGNLLKMFWSSSVFTQGAYLTSLYITSLNSTLFATCTVIL